MVRPSCLTAEGTAGPKRAEDSPWSHSKFKPVLGLGLRPCSPGNALSAKAREGCVRGRSFEPSLDSVMCRRGDKGGPQCACLPVRGSEACVPAGVTLGDGSDHSPGTPEFARAERGPGQVARGTGVPQGRVVLFPQARQPCVYWEVFPAGGSKRSCSNKITRVFIFPPMEVSRGGFYFYVHEGARRPSAALFQLAPLPCGPQVSELGLAPAFPSMHCPL